MWLDEYNIDGIKITDTATMLYLDYGKNPGEWTPNMYGGNENLDAIEFIKQMNEYVHKRNDGVITIADEKSLWSDVTRNNDNEDSLGFDYKLNDGFNEEFFEFVKQDPLFRKGMYNRVTYEMLYHYKEHFITNLTYEALKDDTLYAMVSGNDDKQRLSDIRAVLGYIYTYPGPVCVSYGNDTGALVSVDDDKMQILSRLEEPAYKQMKAYIKALNTLYTTDNSMYEADSLSDGFEWVDNYNAELTVYSYARYSSDNDMDIVAVNFTPGERKAYELNVPKAGKYKLVFNSDNDIMKTIDRYVSGRVYILGKYYHDQGLALLPRNQEYFYASYHGLIDNAYMYILLYCGWIFAIAFFAALCVTLVRLYKAGGYKELVMLSVFALYGIMEQFVLNGFMNPFILLAGVLLYPTMLNEISDGGDNGKISNSSNS